MNKFLMLTSAVILFAISCSSEKFGQGKRIYEAYCLNCHMADGKGLGQLYPNLHTSTYLTSNKENLVCLIRHGKTSASLATVQMPAHKMLKEAELSNLINYLCHTWGDQKPMIITDIQRQLKECP